MTNDEREGFYILMNSLAERYGRQKMSERTLSFSFAAINGEIPNVTLTELTQIAVEHMRYGKFMPSDSELIDAVLNRRERNESEANQIIALPKPRELTREEAMEAMRVAREHLEGIGLLSVIKKMPDEKITVSSKTPDIVDGEVIRQREEQKRRVHEFLVNMTETND